MRFTNSHEWVHLLDDTATVGITDFARNEYGEIVYIEFPKIGHIVKAGEQICVVESTKAAADIYSPLSGEIVEINKILQEKVDLINTSAHNDGWLYKIKLTTPQEYEKLLTDEQYKDLVYNYDSK